MSLLPFLHAKNKGVMSIHDLLFISSRLDASSGNDSMISLSASRCPASMAACTTPHPSFLHKLQSAPINNRYSTMPFISFMHATSKGVSPLSDCLFISSRLHSSSGKDSMTILSASRSPRWLIIWATLQPPGSA